MESVDVIIVGAGLSGIGTACHLQRECPGRRYRILEAREAMGGTWDLFRYPGIRSDSDMHTLGYNFKPWRADKSIADGPAIRDYIEETAREYDITQHIEYGQRVVDANWDSASARWLLTIESTGDGSRHTQACQFLMMCAGYYSYTQPHAPTFPGQDSFEGTIVHPQFWPEDLDYSNQNVVVIGSGATAITLVPAMADRAASITMLQRSPTWYVTRPDRDWIANTLRRLLPADWAYWLTRRKNTWMQQRLYHKCRTQPDMAAEKLLKQVRAQLGDAANIEGDFTPRYTPWEQRMCLVPNGDLFTALASGEARVVTDEIETFEPRGIRLKSGNFLEADLIITATGLQLTMFGEAKVSVDGAPIAAADTWSYKGCMYSGVPNFATIFGYINASWTLRADLIAEYACRLLNHMSESGTEVATPVLRPEDEGMTARPWIEDFSAGYMQRFMDQYPRQGDHEPWLNPQNLASDRHLFREAPLEDGVMQFTSRAAERKVA